jgi:hypothetical protein
LSLDDKTVCPPFPFLNKNGVQFKLTAAHVGYDVELRMCDEEHMDTPFVLVFTPDEIFDAFSE